MKIKECELVEVILVGGNKHEIYVPIEFSDTQKQEFISLVFGFGHWDSANVIPIKEGF